MKAKIKTDNIERRFTPTKIEVRTETRDDKEVKEIKFTPIVFNKRADLGWFEEIIDPKAFDGLIATQDIRALKNHNPNYPLARSNKGEGTLSIDIDENGVNCSFIPRDRSYVNDLIDEIEAEDISQGSFAFRTVPGTGVVWERSEKYGEGGLRVVKKVENWSDVSIVTYPAYPDTSVAKRSHDDYIAEKEPAKEPENKNKSLGLRQAQININKNH